jgi:hypothetical protein
MKLTRTKKQYQCDIYAAIMLAPKNFQILPLQSLESQIQKKTVIMLKVIMIENYY